MASPRQNAAARHREAKRPAPETMSAPARWLRRRETLVAAAFLVGFALVGGLVAVLAGDQPRYSLNQVAPAPIYARVAFLANDKKLTWEAKQDAAKREPNVY